MRLQDFPCEIPAEHSYTSCSDSELNNTGYCSRCTQLALHQRDDLKNRVAELEDAIRGVIDCTKEPGGACVCIQYAETVLNKNPGARHGH